MRNDKLLRRPPPRLVAAAAPPDKQEPPEVFDVIEQGSAEWFELRLGIPTASMFSTIMATGADGGESRGRDEYMRRLAGEQLTGEPAESFKSKAMQRGNDMEPEARFHYARTNFVELRRVGFVRRKLPRGGAFVGCSPDSLIGTDGGVEFKTMSPHILIQQATRATMPPKYRAQVHGTMWVCDLAWMDLVLFYRGMPISPRFRVERDEKFIKDLSDAVQVFEYELRTLVKKIREMGR